MENLECPYCLHEFENYQDEGYDDGETSEIECPKCYKIFGFCVSYLVCYSEYELPCKNGQACKYKRIYRTPSVISGKVGLRCQWCGEEKSIPWEEGEKWGYDLKQLEKDNKWYNDLYNNSACNE